MVEAAPWLRAVQQTVTVVQSGNDETAQHGGGSAMVDSCTTDRYSSPSLEMMKLHSMVVAALWL